MIALALSLLLAPHPSEAALVRSTLRLIGRFGAGHACPVEPRIALTNGHMVDLRPFGDTVLAPFGSAYSDGVGNAGFLVPINERLERWRDLAAVEPLTQGAVFVDPLPVAKQPPLAGDRIWLLGYDWRSKKSALADDVIEAKVTRIVALHVQFYPAGQGGSSGSCVLNDAGEVVAINSAGWPTDDKEEGGQAVGIWGVFKDLPK